MQAIKVRDVISILLSDGETIEIPNTEENWDFIKENRSDEQKILNKYAPEEAVIIDVERIQASNILYLKGDSVVMPSVSDISIPKDIITQILKAEDSKNEVEINKWINFWTFVSMNPNEEVRDNIFWFLKRWGVQITDSGLIRAYRNVDIKENSKYSTEFVKNIINSYYTEKYINHVNPAEILDAKGISLAQYYDEIINKGEGSPLYTDNYTHTFKIKLGQVVSMPREECDSDSGISCSRGLHAGSAGWLERNYFGTVGLEVLVNPSKVCSVPTIDNYGKMRCCEYFPIAIVDFNQYGHVIVPPLSLYNDIEYLQNMTIDGEINNKEGQHYSVTKCTKEKLYQSILERLNK